MTKREILTYINDTVIPTIDDATIAAELATYVSKEFAALDKKAASAKAYAAKKRDELDALCDEILEVMTTDLVPIDVIVAALNNEEVTKAKVQARLSKMHKAGMLAKDSVNVAPEGSKKRMAVAYGLVSVPSNE